MCVVALVSQTPKSADTQTHPHMKLSRACPGHISPIRNKYDIVHKETFWPKVFMGPDFFALIYYFHTFSLNKSHQK